MGRYPKLVDTPKGMTAFRAKYRIPENVELQHCELREWRVSKPPEAIVIPMIVFIEDGMEISMGRITRDFLINSRLYPTQCS